MTSARDLYISALPESVREAWRASRELAADLAAALAAATAAWPDLTLDPDAFVAYLAARAEPAPPATGGFAHAADLALACAIVAGSADAMRLFETHCLAAIPAAVSRFRLSSDELDELKQTLRRQLLMAEPGRAARLGDYSGRGKLGAWLRVAAVRAVIKLRRGGRDAIADDDALEGVAAGGPSAEARMVSAESRALFREALREAIGSLDAQEQNVLRQHHLDGLTLDQLGALYHVHRTTVAYWLERARERLFKRTRAVLVDRNRMTASDCDSLFRHASSYPAVTMQRLFRE